MQIIQYTEEMNMKIYKFFQKVFKENARSFSPLGKESDILDISKNYMIDGNFWCLINEKKAICGTIALRKLKDCYEINLLNIAVNYSIDNNYSLLKAATMSNGLAAQHIFLANGFSKTECYNNSTADIFFSLK